MVILSKIYTRKGDKGKTSITNNVQISKSSLRIKSIGEVDETNAFIGLVQLYLDKTSTHYIILRRIQDDLFDLGADLSNADNDFNDQKNLRITNDQVSRIEHEIDSENKNLPPLKSFVLPGGEKSASYLHIARTVSRRAERVMVELSEEESVNPNALIYINRLSDLLFVLSRSINYSSKKEVLWRPGANREQ